MTRRNEEGEGKRTGGTIERAMEVGGVVEEMKERKKEWVGINSAMTF